MKNFLRKVGQFFIVVGPLVGISPFVFSLIGLFINPDLTLYHWFAVITFPVGICVAVVGLVLFAISTYIPQRPGESDQNLSFAMLVILSLVIGILIIPFMLFLSLNQ